MCPPTYRKIQISSSVYFICSHICKFQSSHWILFIEGQIFWHGPIFIFCFCSVSFISIDSVLRTLSELWFFEVIVCVRVRGWPNICHLLMALDKRSNFKQIRQISDNIKLRFLNRNIWTNFTDKKNSLISVQFYVLLIISYGTS